MPISDTSTYNFPRHELIYKFMIYHYFNEPGKFDRNGNYDYDCNPNDYDPQSEYNYFMVIDAAYFILKDKSRAEQIQIGVDLLQYVHKVHYTNFIHTIVVNYVRNNPTFIKDIVKLFDTKNTDTKKMSIEQRSEAILDIILAHSPAAIKGLHQTNNSNADVEEDTLQAAATPELVEEQLSGVSETEENVSQTSVITELTDEQLPVDSESSIAINNNEIDDYINLQKATEATLYQLTLLGEEVLGEEKYYSYVSKLSDLIYLLTPQIHVDKAQPLNQQQLSEYSEEVNNILQYIEVIKSIHELNEQLAKPPKKLTTREPLFEKSTPAEKKPLSLFARFKLLLRDLIAKIKEFFGIKTQTQQMGQSKKATTGLPPAENQDSNARQTVEQSKTHDLGPIKGSLRYSAPPEGNKPNNSDHDPKKDSTNKPS